MNRPSYPDVSIVQLRGTDSLMRGDKSGLGTPQEDIASIAAVDNDHQATPRTCGIELLINPLMPVYWCFRLAAVAQRILYLDAMRATETYDDVQAAIKNFRGTCRPRHAQAILGWE